MSLLLRGLVACTVLCALPARAEIGALDEVPAATLLLPYFEVDLDAANGLTTVLSIGNAQEGPAIAHFTLWTDLSVPTLDFNVYLTGFDVVTIDLRPFFTNGFLPPTSHNNPAISNVGVFSLTTHPVTGVGPSSLGCSGQLPLPPLPLSLREHIRAAHTGQASFVYGGLCTGIDYGDDIARGYVTIDNVDTCSLDFPGDTGYFVHGGAGVASNVNALLGDFAYIDPSRQRAEGHTMLHLEASSSDPLTQPGEYTFYARYTGGADNRESLPTTYWARYAAGGTAGENASLIYWRDSKRTITPFSCFLPYPGPFPLSTNLLAIFDAAENGEVPAVSPTSPPPALTSGGLLPLPWEAGRVLVGGAAFPVAPDEGWMFLNLNSTVAGSQVPHEPATQGWIGVSFEAADGSYRYGQDVFALDNAGAFAELMLPVCDGPPDPPACPPLFADGFESGNTAAWSLVVP